MLSLTQTEAEKRAALLSVQAYDVDVDLTALPSRPEFRATSTVQFTCREPGASSFVECAAEVESATLNGVPLESPEQGRIALPDLAERNALVVTSVQTNIADGEGVHRAIDPADGQVYLWTSFEPDEAKYAWACFDQPDLKATWAFSVTAPADWRVVSNMASDSVGELGEARRWVFAPTPPLSSYNPVVLAGPFAEIRRTVAGFDLGIFARRSLQPILERDAEEIFTVTGQGLEFFGDAFAMPFPEDKYDQVFLPEFGGAMENYGCVAWSDAFLRRSLPTPAELELLAKVLLHEMAHMWFGNIVTMRWWDDLWLNEAFAEFACNWAAERATRYTDAWATHLAADKLEAYLADQGPISHPIRQQVRDVDEAASIFDAITYPKGASVLQQLMTYVGEEGFRRGMQAYFAEHAWGNTTLADLVAAQAEASGRDLRTWEHAWLETAGPDRLVLERRGKDLVLAGRGPSGGPPRPQVVGVGAYRRTSEGLRRIAFEQLAADAEWTPVNVPLDADLFLVNDDDLTFATSRPEPGSEEAFLDVAAELPTAISRGVAVATVVDMLMHAEIGAGDAVRCLTAVLRVETADTVVEPYLAQVAKFAEQWSSDTERDRLMALVAETCHQLADTSVHRRVALRGLARTAPDLDTVAWLEDAAGDDVDLRWRALARKAELGALDQSAVERLLDEDPDPDAWVRGLTVRTAAPTDEAKREFWETAVVGRKVPIGAFGLVSTSFWRPGQEQVTAPYADRYLDLLPRLDEGGMIPAMVYTARLFPLFGIDTDYLDRAAQAATSAAPVVRKTLAERSDEVRRMLAARAT